MLRSDVNLLNQPHVLNRHRQMVEFAKRSTDRLLTLLESIIPLVFWAFFIYYALYVVYNILICYSLQVSVTTTPISIALTTIRLITILNPLTNSFPNFYPK